MVHILVVTTRVETLKHKLDTKVQQLVVFTGGGFDQLFIQIVGCIAYAVWTVITCYIAWKVIGAAFGGIRVTEEQEKLGLDITEHGIEAYPDYAMSGSGVSNR